MAVNEQTRAKGIEELKKIADRFPTSKNVCALVAQALDMDGRQEEAIEYIKKRFPDVLK